MFDCEYYTNTTGTRDRKRYQLGLVANEVTKRDLRFQTDSMESAMDWTQSLVSSVGIPKFTRDTSGYRFICDLTRVETNKDAIEEIQPKYRTERSTRNEALQIGEGSFADVYVRIQAYKKYYLCSRTQNTDTS